MKIHLISLIDKNQTKSEAFENFGDSFISSSYHGVSSALLLLFYIKTVYEKKIEKFKYFLGFHIFMYFIIYSIIISFFNGFIKIPILIIHHVSLISARLFIFAADFIILSLNFKKLILLTFDLYDRVNLKKIDFAYFLVCLVLKFFSPLYTVSIEISDFTIEFNILEPILVFSNLILIIITIIKWKINQKIRIQKTISILLHSTLSIGCIIIAQSITIFKIIDGSIRSDGNRIRNARLIDNRVHLYTTRRLSSSATKTIMKRGVGAAWKNGRVLTCTVTGSFGLVSIVIF
ncbi:Protein CBG24009 [Caenorhabditis briggsae]|uniref:Protein CBG24009 n=1 Tax=Caenorhabditis briggsae TaxID=6238 RepID=A8WJS6_CAEBR|nr:Protein CBG24009 [Caenorhabditis briggsae]CAP20719.1 Protein CBG24009 [Caenorhabditis briggsae]